jgi:hypothetical protein
MPRRKPGTAAVRGQKQDAENAKEKQRERGEKLDRSNQLSLRSLRISAFSALALLLAAEAGQRVATYAAPRRS